MLFKIKNMSSCIYLVLLLALVFGLLNSCGEENIHNPQHVKNAEGDQLSEEEFFDQNVAFADARVRSISQTQYVREIVLISFSKENRMPSSVIFDGTTFFDNGFYNDLIAYDGVYTSAATFIHCDKIPHNKNFIVKSVMEEIIIDINFQHRHKLEKMAEIYVKPINSSFEGIVQKGGGEVSLTCDLEFGLCGCRADKWGWCDCCCFTISGCKIKIAFKW